MKKSTKYILAMTFIAIDLISWVACDNVFGDEESTYEDSSDLFSFISSSHSLHDYTLFTTEMERI